MLFFTDSFDNRTYGPFPSEAVAREWMAEIGLVSAVPTFEAPAVSEAIAPRAEWMAEAIRITQSTATPATQQPACYSLHGCGPDAARLNSDRLSAEGYARMMRNPWPGLPALQARCELRIRQAAARIIGAGC